MDGPSDAGTKSHVSSFSFIVPSFLPSIQGFLMTQYMPDDFEKSKNRQNTFILEKLVVRIKHIQNVVVECSLKVGRI